VDIFKHRIIKRDAYLNLAKLITYSIVSMYFNILKIQIITSKLVVNKKHLKVIFFLMSRNE